ncbi:MAG: amidohydrolase family protein [Gemmatimonadota bacterium]
MELHLFLYALAQLGSYSLGRLSLDTTKITAFADVTVVPMDRERVIEHQTVLVRNGRISAIGPVKSVAVPRGAVRIDGSGKYLIPGLADMHIHLSENDEDNRSLLALYLANGVTTVLNLNGSPRHLALRDSIARGEVLGPTIHTAGPIVNDSTLTFEGGQRLAVDYKAKGYEYVKVYNVLSQAGYAGIMAGAKRAGIPVIGHIVRSLGPHGLADCEPRGIICHCPTCAELSFNAGQVGVVHAEEFLYTYFDYHPTRSPKNPADLEPQIPVLAKRVAAARVSVTPTLEAYKTITEQIEDLEKILARPEVAYVPPRLLQRWQRPANGYVQRYKPTDAPAFWQAYGFQEKLVKAFQAAGVRLLAGTDAGITGVVAGFSLHGDLQDLVGAGLTPYQALRAATENPAEFLHATDEVGAVAVGRRADLILVNSNPLTDVRNAARRAGVMVRGRWMPEAELERMLDGLKPKR